MIEKTISHYRIVEKLGGVRKSGHLLHFFLFGGGVQSGLKGSPATLSRRRRFHETDKRFPLSSALIFLLIAVLACVRLVLKWK